MCGEVELRQFMYDLECVREKCLAINPTDVRSRLSNSMPPEPALSCQCAGLYRYQESVRGGIPPKMFTRNACWVLGLLQCQCGQPWGGESFSCCPSNVFSAGLRPLVSLRALGVHRLLGQSLLS